MHQKEYYRSRFKTTKFWQKIGKMARQMYQKTLPKNNLQRSRCLRHSYILGVLLSYKEIKQLGQYLSHMQQLVWLAILASACLQSLDF